jgi:hypothetical protein
MISVAWFARRCDTAQANRQAGENGADRNDHQQLDQREPPRRGAERLAVSWILGLQFKPLTE